ncbi:hypothetical protein LVY72_20565 [Arthrobacter sp. I2-34]|uniref:Uncharacterized protein n=1 Tax=Arthrobacter hankyongi TaxID=2904801 RepID=A0ABS9LC76_9MICC|nr:hypothetical protein [Arthrobacter hankyongi]MCG2624287.1 hypothetical protein [Arthrobacter hankyongi]
MDLAQQFDLVCEAKAGLVDFAESPGFERLYRRLFERGLENGSPEMARIDALESMIFERQETGRRTLLERYLAVMPGLPPEERTLLEDWRDRHVLGVFETLSRTADKMVLRNLQDELDYTVYSTMGAEAIKGMRKGGFIFTRIVPVGGVWTLSGTSRLFAPEERKAAGRLLAEVCYAYPAGAFRNPAKLEQARRMTADYHRIFVSLFGGPVITGTGRETQERFNRFLAACTAEALAKLPGKGGKMPVPATVELPEEILHHDDVAFRHHPVRGTSILRNYSAAAAAHARPPATPDDGVAAVRHYLEDPGVSGDVLRELAAAHPDTVDALYRLVLEDPDFIWERDGEEMLRRHKPANLWEPDMPDITILPGLAEEFAHEAGRTGH